MATAVFTSCGGGSSVSDIELYPVKSGNTYEYVNRKGVIVINPQFDRATVFRGGVALVRSEGSDLWGYINTKGEFVTEKRYKSATTFSEGLAWTVEEDQAPAAIDSKGNVKFTLKEALNVRSFHNGFAAFCNFDNLYGFVDKSGKVKIEPKFSRTGDFSEGLCEAFDAETHKWGYINTKGEFTINPQFDRTTKFVNGLAVVALDGTEKLVNVLGIVEVDKKYGAVDKNGKYVINPQFDNMEADGNLFLVEQDGKYGWCNNKGQFVINPQFYLAHGFYGSYIAAVHNGDAWGYIDRNGKYVINPQFELATPFSGNLALVSNGDQVGMIDKKGNYAVNPQFQSAAEDISSYLKGYSEYNTVKSDYFNAEDVVAVFDFNSPEGLTAASTYEDISDRFNIRQNAFGKYTHSHAAVMDKLVGTKVTYTLTVNGTPYDKKVSKGWWSYTEYIFNAKRKPESYTYSIKSGNHTDEILNLIDKKLQENRTAESGKNQMKYSNDTQEISVSENNPYINVTIKFKNTTAQTKADSEITE
jgi:hypothetical protein